MGAKEEIAGMLRTVDRLPAIMTARLRVVAGRIATAVEARAKQNLLAQIRGHNTEHHQRTADSFVIREQPEKKQFLVAIENPDNPNLALWLERGTRKMTARPYLRPAADALEATYQREMVTAAEDVMTKALGAE